MRRREYYDLCLSQARTQSGRKWLIALLGFVSNGRAHLSPRHIGLIRLALRRA